MTYCLSQACAAVPDLAAIAADPLLLVLALFAATFIAEDTATIAAGVWVGSTGSDPFLALGAVIIGTGLGDLALYGLGRWSASTQIGSRLRDRKDVDRALTAFRHRTLGLLFVARFVPGTRFPVLTAAGIAAAPFRFVAAVVLLTTPIWTTILFAAAHQLGAGVAGELVGIALWLGVAIALLLHAPRKLGGAIMK